MAHAPKSTISTGAYPNLTGRFERNRRDIRSAFEFRNESIPFIVNDVNYWLDGDDPQRIPADYFEHPASMVEYQLRKIDHHLRAFDDAYIPLLHPWYGVGVVPTALGCQLHIPARGDPVLKSTVLRSPGTSGDCADPTRTGTASCPRCSRPSTTWSRTRASLSASPIPKGRSASGPVRGREPVRLDVHPSRGRPPHHGVLHRRAHRLDQGTEGARPPRATERSVASRHLVARGIRRSYASPTTIARRCLQICTQSSSCPTTRGS